MRVGEQRLNAWPAVAAAGALLVDNTDLDNGRDRDQPDPGAHRSRADRRDVGPRVGGRAPDADVALARTCSPRSPSDAGSSHEDHLPTVRTVALQAIPLGAVR
jgi:hypothetical protein